ncbi:MAG: hypothetical protein R3E10_00270 [Gemmatimonadota bacterium]
MPGACPPFPSGRPRSFNVTVHGTVFGDRERYLEQVVRGQALRLAADPPVQPEPQVWVHLASGEPVGHLPDEVGTWLAPWLQKGGHAEAEAIQVHGAEAPSWRRLVVHVECKGGED